MLQTRKSVASLIDPHHPLVCSLGRIFGGFLAGRNRPVPGVSGSREDGEKRQALLNRDNITIRTDVVNEKLCDDVLQYLAPTLEPYKGCTIIDVHPGACLWSRKLHAFLQPKHHLLMEPEERYHDLFIKPLLQQPRSRYKLTPLSGAHPRPYFQNYEDVFNDVLLPRRPKLDDDDPQLRKLDTSLLVTGNLARRYNTAAWHTQSRFANFILQQMTWAALANDLFHRAGLVRMLWWVPDAYKMNNIPERITQTSSQSFSIQFGADVTEVAGVDWNYHLRKDSPPGGGRHPLLDAESARLTRARAHQMEMRTPENAELRPLTGTEFDSYIGMKSPVDVQRAPVEDVNRKLLEVENRFHSAFRALDSTQGVRGGLQDALKPFWDSIEYPQSIPLVVSIERLGGQTAKPSTLSVAEPSNLPPSQQRAIVVLDLYLRIINLEAHYKAWEDQRGNDDSLKSRVIALGVELQQKCNEDYRTMSEALELLIADQLALFASPPPLAYDRRPYEPLQSKSEDFWPRTDLTLLDVVPKPRDLSVPGLATHTEGVRTAQELIRYLFNYRIQPLPWVLDKIAPNAAQDLIPKVPSLTDPRRGGRLNVKALQIRNLTDEMVEGLTKAWIEWPFKPERFDIALESGGDDGHGVEGSDSIPDEGVGEDEDGR